MVGAPRRLLPVRTKMSTTHHHYEVREQAELGRLAGWRAVAGDGQSVGRQVLID